MTRLFLDTEFADQHGMELISLALVGEDGQHEFYAERDPLPDEATDFVRENVYPLLDRGAAALDDITFTMRLRSFLGAMDAPHIIYDYSGDWRLLMIALSGFNLPREAAVACGPMPRVEGTHEKRSAIEEYTQAWFDDHPRATRHHALVDARALRAAWLRVSCSLRW